MGGKTGTSSTQVEIPEWLDSSLQPFITDALSRYDKFASAGADVIMPPGGKRSVDVRNPWAISPLLGEGTVIPPSPFDTPDRSPIDDSDRANSGAGGGAGPGGGGSRSGTGEPIRRNKN